MLGESQRALDVELVDFGLVAVQLRERQLLFDPGQMVLVGLLVEGALVEVGLDDPLLALAEVLQPLLDRPPPLGRFLLVFVPPVKHRSGEQPQHLLARPQPVEKLDEPCLQLFLADVDAAALAAFVVGVAGQLALRPAARDRPRALVAADEAPEGEVRML